jgi:hypothetical protein
MSETGTKDWKVIAVRSGKTEPNPHGGQFQRFYVDFEGSPDTYWRRKEGDAPGVGNSYYGTITVGDYGPRFKKEKLPEDFAGTSSGGSRNLGSKWQPESERDPERSARILRQHSQEMALRYLTVSGFSVDPENRSVALEQNVRPIIDWFDADVIQAAQKAGGSLPHAEAGTASAATPPAAQEAQSNAEYLSKLLEQAGFPLIQIPPLQRYIETQLDGERRSKVEAALGSSDLSVCARATELLIAETEKWTGEKLPSPAEADSTEVPF